MNNIEVGQKLFIRVEGSNSLKIVMVIGIYRDCSEQDDPKRYMRIVTRDPSRECSGTVTFFPEDFGKVIFTADMVRENNRRVQGER